MKEYLVLNKSYQRGEAEVAVILGVAGIAAWFTHIFICLQAGKWGFLIAGALVFPIAIIHGIGIWFGFWH